MPAARKKKFRLTDEQREDVGKNFPFAVYVAKKMTRNSGPTDDEIQEGAIGLCKSKRVKFDPKKGSNPSTVVGRCIANEILNARRDYGLIRIPGYLQEKKNAGHPLRDLADRASRRIDIDGIPEYSRHHPTVAEDDEAEFGWKAMRAVRWAVQKLPPVERDVIRGLIFREETHCLLGKKHGMHPSVIRFLEKSALAKLRTSLAKHV